MRDKRGRLSRVLNNSEVELGAELPDARISRLGYHTHLAVQVTIRVVELRMVEEVKEFCLNFKRHRFGNLSFLCQTDIKLVDPGTVEELSIGVAELS